MSLLPDSSHEVLGLVLVLIVCCNYVFVMSAGVLGPISDTKGLGPSGALKMQNIDKPYSRSKYFNGKQVPVSLSGSLPGM